MENNAELSASSPSVCFSTPYNTSNYAFTNICGTVATPLPYSHFYETTRLITGLVIYPVVCITGLVGNVMALIVLSRPAMTTSYNVILAALAVNDVIKLLNDFIYFCDVVLSRVSPSAENVLFGYMYPVSHYIFSQTACITAWLTVSVAVERYICVCWPTTYRTICTVRRAVVVAISVFLSMSISALPSAFRYRSISCVVAEQLAAPCSLSKNDVYTSYSSVTSISSSIATAPTTAVNRTFYAIRPTLGADHLFTMIYYNWTLALLRSIVPLIVLIALNTSIVKVIWKRSTAFSQSTYTTTTTNSGNTVIGSSPPDVSHRRCRRHAAKNRGVTVMLAAVVFVFVVCTVPDAIMSIGFHVGYYDEENLLWRGVRELTDTLLALSSAINFIVYCLGSHRFRCVLIETLCSVK